MMQIVLSLSFLCLFFPSMSLRPLDLSQSGDVGHPARNYNQVITDLIEKLSPTIQSSPQGDVFLYPKKEVREQSFMKIISIAKKSLKLRYMVIDALLNTFEDEHKGAFIRIYMASLLVELKASIAIDSLVNHLDIVGPFDSLSLTIMPMVSIIVKMGKPAIPSLERVLFNGNIIIKQKAAITLGFIGGEKAKGVLQRALRTESQESVIEYIKSGLAEVDRNPIR